MSISKIFGSAFAVSAALALTLATNAHADPEFSVSAADGKVTVTSQGGWHVNKEYPWKLSVGDQKLDKSKFTFSETSATLSGAPKGKGKLKGGVCSGDKCKNFEVDVTL